MLKVSHAYYLWFWSYSLHALLLLCYDFASNSGLYWIVIFYKADFKIAHIRSSLHTPCQVDYIKLSFAVVCY